MTKLTNSAIRIDKDFRKKKRGLTAAEVNMFLLDGVFITLVDFFT